MPYVRMKASDGRIRGFVHRIREDGKTACGLVIHPDDLLQEHEGWRPLCGNCQRAKTPAKKA